MAHITGQDASIRAQPRAFREDRATGRWRPSDEVTGLYEVICTVCGDDGGPYDRQPPSVQAVRGPYPTLRAARRALADHIG